jgi:hypothetical protein
MSRYTVAFLESHREDRFRWVNHHLDCVVVLSRFGRQCCTRLARVSVPGVRPSGPGLPLRGTSGRETMIMTKEIAKTLPRSRPRQFILDYHTHKFNPSPGSDIGRATRI